VNASRESSSPRVEESGAEIPSVIPVSGSTRSVRRSAEPAALS
jgi:hypothetical protein